MKDKRNTAIYIAYDDYRPLDEAEPERNLLLAILSSALVDLEQEGEARRRAVEFFLSPEDDYIFSFRAICSYLNVDPGKILLVKGISQDLTAEKPDATHNSTQNGKNPRQSQEVS
ncbi:hypothetical protein OAO01_04795 [Oligoflexia bacterium]|nr:hypothetical protein [Oligoflexia bacterium]